MSFSIHKNGTPRGAHGFTLLEILIGLAVFILFAVGIYTGIQFVFKSVYQSRLRIIQTAVLNEQIEIIRNMSFFDVGILNGSPAGLLERTTTTTRNNIELEITRTVRNVDDPFDGTIGGDPNDTAPADYKFVDIEVICNSCNQQSPVRMTTTVAPRYLEGDPTHGALFIEVFDADAQPVQGADVHIVATTTDPTYDFTDTTDNDGFLRIVDLDEGLSAYQIVVTKDGFTTDQTIDTVENPVKPLASVIAQDVSSISFQIDEESQVDLSTVNSFCSAIPSVNVDVRGTKLIATDPDILKVDETITTDGSGLYTFSGVEWDNYTYQAQGYDIIGSIPLLPLSVLPGVTLPVQLMLGPNTTHSLLVHVQDNITLEAISQATVTVSEGAYNESIITGQGHMRQTDWSGGSGQLEVGDDDRYWSDDGNVDVSTSPGDVTLEFVGASYLPSGEFESSIFDLGTTVEFIDMDWEPFAQPAETGASSLRFQIATAASSTPPSWDYLGPDGTASTYYDENAVSIHESHDNDQFLRYKAFFSTADTDFTPTLSDLTISYTTACTPPGQAYFGGLSETDYTVDVAATGYQPFSTVVSVSNESFYSVNMVQE